MDENGHSWVSVKLEDWLKLNTLWRSFVYPDDELYYCELCDTYKRVLSSEYLIKGKIHLFKINNTNRFYNLNCSEMQIKNLLE